MSLTLKSFFRTKVDGIQSKLVMDRMKKDPQTLRDVFAMLVKSVRAYSVAPKISVNVIYFWTGAENTIQNF